MRYAVSHHAENGDFVNMVFQDERFKEALSALMMDKVYGRLTAPNEGTEMLR